MSLGWLLQLLKNGGEVPAASVGASSVRPGLSSAGTSRSASPAPLASAVSGEAEGAPVAAAGERCYIPNTLAAAGGGFATSHSIEPTMSAALIYRHHVLDLSSQS